MDNYEVARLIQEYILDHSKSHGEISINHVETIDGLEYTLDVGGEFQKWEACMENDFEISVDIQSIELNGLNFEETLEFTISDIKQIEELIQIQ